MRFTIVDKDAITLFLLLFIVAISVVGLPHPQQSNLSSSVAVRQFVIITFDGYDHVVTHRVLTNLTGS